MKLPLANYKKEQEQFQALLDPQNPQRILMFQGESGAGKTRLLEHCMSQVPAHISYLSIQMRGQDTTELDVFYRFGRRIGWDLLPTFVRQVAKFSSNPDAHKDITWRYELRQHLQTIMYLESLVKQKKILEMLTDALFADLHRFQTPCLLVFDTYEKATPELDKWFSHQFLTSVADTNNVYVLIAGTELPIQSADWGYCCSYHELRGILDAEAWLPVAQAMGRKFPSIDYLAGVCDVLKGNPHKILAYLRTLPSTNSTKQQPAQTIASSRSRLRQNMGKYFQGIELEELCFDFNIDYDDLTGKEKKGKIIALIKYMESRGRLPELIAQCKALRPKVDWYDG